MEEEGPSQHRKSFDAKHMKILLYAVIFAVFQITIVTLFTLTIMKFRSPMFRVSSISFETSDVQQSSFNMRMNAQYSVSRTRISVTTGTKTPPLISTMGTQKLGRHLFKGGELNGSPLGGLMLQWNCHRQV